MDRISFFFNSLSSGSHSPKGGQKILILFVIWLVVMLSLSFFLYRIDRSHPLRNESSEPRGFLQSIVRYDTGWYINIARFGYHSDIFLRGPGQVYLSAAYFPLYPVLIRLFSYPMLGNFELAALAVSWLALLFALIYLFMLAGLYHDEKTSFRICLFILIFPSAIFFLFPYSESLFLLCAVASFYHARRSSWLLCGIWAFLSCLLRPAGIAVFFMISLEALRKSDWSLEKTKRSMAAVFLTPLGLVGYFFYLQWRFGDFFYYLKAQKEGWDSGFHPLAVFSAVKHLIAPVRLGEFARYSCLLSFLILFVFLLYFVFKRYGSPLGFFMLIYLVILILSTSKNAPLESLTRHALVLFPGFMILGWWGKNRNFKRFYVIAGIIGFAIFYSALYGQLFYWINS